MLIPSSRSSAPKAPATGTRIRRGVLAGPVSWRSAMRSSCRASRPGQSRFAITGSRAAVPHRPLVHTVGGPSSPAVRAQRKLGRPRGLPARSLDYGVDRRRSAGACDRYAVVAVAYGVAPAHARDADRRELSAPVLGEPDPLPACASSSRRAEAAIEQPRARGLEGPHDRVDRDLADDLGRRDAFRGSRGRPGRREGKNCSSGARTTPPASRVLARDVHARLFVPE